MADNLTDGSIYHEAVTAQIVDSARVSFPIHDYALNAQYIVTAIVPIASE